MERLTDNLAGRPLGCVVGDQSNGATDTGGPQGPFLTIPRARGAASGSKKKRLLVGGGNCRLTPPQPPIRPEPDPPPRTHQPRSPGGTSTRRLTTCSPPEELRVFSPAGGGSARGSATRPFGDDHPSSLRGEICSGEGGFPCQNPKSRHHNLDLDSLDDCWLELSPYEGP